MQTALLHPNHLPSASAVSKHHAGSQPQHPLKPACTLPFTFYLHLPLTSALPALERSLRPFTDSPVEQASPRAHGSTSRATLLKMTWLHGAITTAQTRCPTRRCASQAPTAWCVLLVWLPGFLFRSSDVCVCPPQVSFVFVCKVDGKDVEDEPPPPKAFGAAAGGPLRLAAPAAAAPRAPLSSMQSKVRLAHAQLAIVA